MQSFISHNGGAIEEGQVVKAYVNLRNGLIGIRNKSGKVQGYCESITLQNAHFYVPAKTLDRVRKVHSKEVFAYCIGTYKNVQAKNDRAVSFNPFCEIDTFYFKDTREGISSEETFETVTLKNKLAFI
jgi:hypothetical protein